MKRNHLLAWLAVLGIVLSGSSFAIGEGGQPYSTESKVLSKLHHGNEMEIRMGRLAVTRAGKTVRPFAQRLIDDHTAADRQLFEVAQRENIRLFTWRPQTEEERIEMQRHHDLMARLSMLQLGEFDKEFLPAMIASHEKTLEGLNLQLPGLSLNVRTFIESLIPTIQSHRDEAKRLLEQP